MHTVCQLVGQVLSSWAGDGERERLTIRAVGIDFETLGANQLDMLRVFPAIGGIDEATQAKNGDFEHRDSGCCEVYLDGDTAECQGQWSGQ